MKRIVILLLVLALYSPCSMAARSILVAAASNMSTTLAEITDQFEKKSGIKVKLSFGSSGNFARQILQGAPYQIFLSADKNYLDKLTDSGYMPVRSQEFTRGRIGFFIPAGSKLSAKTNLQDIINAIEFDNYDRLVYANPKFAPYGSAAVQALQSAGVWVIDKKKLLMGENAAQALQFSLSGGVDIAIIPASYAVLPKVNDKGRFILIPEQWHKPIQQYLALLSGKNPSAVQFYEYLLSPEPQYILAKYGYTTHPIMSVSSRP